MTEATVADALHSGCRPACDCCTAPAAGRRARDSSSFATWYAPLSGRHSSLSVNNA